MTERKARIITNIVCLVLGAGIMFGGIYASNAWERKQNPLPAPSIETEAGDNLLLSPENGKGMKIASKKLSKAEYAENGISAQAESAYTLTVTIEPAEATDKSVTWSLTWKNSASEWATGKTVTDYVTKTESSDGLSLALACNEAFGEPIVATVALRNRPTIKASCQLDYMKRITNTSTALSMTAPVRLAIDGDMIYTFAPEYGVGTVEGTVTERSFEFEFANPTDPRAPAPFKTRLAEQDAWTQAQTVYDGDSFDLKTQVPLQAVGENKIHIALEDFFADKDGSDAFLNAEATEYVKQAFIAVEHSASNKAHGDIHAVIKISCGDVVESYSFEISVSSFDVSALEIAANSVNVSKTQYVF